MNLSEAIREGAKLYPKVTGSFVKLDADDKIVGCCALGGAFIAAYHGDDAETFDETDIDDFLGDWFSTECSARATHPETGIESYLTTIIPSLNDDYAWTREQIADWVEGLGY